MSAFTSANSLDDARELETTPTDHAGIQYVQEGDPVRVHYHTMDDRERDTEDGTVTEVVESDGFRDRTAIVVATQERPLRVTWNAHVAVDVPDQTTNPQVGMWATVEPRGDDQ